VAAWPTWTWMPAVLAAALGAAWLVGAAPAGATTLAIEIAATPERRAWRSLMPYPTLAGAGAAAGAAAVGAAAAEPAAAGAAGPAEA